MAEELNYQDQYADESSVKIKDLEEKQRILKDRILLIGQNLIDTKEKTSETILEMKKDLEEIKGESEKMKLFIENISREFPKFAKKDDLNILAKQLKMFEPLKYLKKE